ncbi:glutamate-ammonia-ligase adenylyltransferase [Tibeticola sediminis]|uniref:Bifunctional glutamine synthetase adenylyltransferase/adenylyl-removing enzyme n=1 Tax=Tibeticola sediminis TaxID=1917811 RepID=A0A3N4VEV9_9BURK|nr:bifunctional [glutamate--ammonia ligase]-adenylyl-L-tyrosine phosphorylase/[glutamate--ammonia-ligase] adenylyltransferase [Tibeticola sediminis]RPE72410.1 glutamate-ammonia-ligase adenylyltransferase [Tibeticola sediminis]
MTSPIDRSSPCTEPVTALAPPWAPYSRFYQRIARRYADERSLLPEGAPDRAALDAAYAALSQRGLALDAALRVVRQLVLQRLIELDCDAQAPLETVTSTMTTLAEWALDLACQKAMEELDARHGAPRKPDGTRSRVWIIGMGKLGARELNVSSDIDLIYVYESDGETEGLPDGRGRISNQEYFARLVRRVQSLIGDNTEHGFVFRVDLALRPNGNSGPVALSLDALEEYFFVQGREWERFAWLKSRAVAPTDALGPPALALRSLVQPFVFRRYLDYAVFESLRALHRQIREHAARRSAGRPGRANDVKLSRGGIREIEFIVQLLQVVRGGQFPELRTRPTLAALKRLARAGLMPAETAEGLAQAYRFLRRVEHRIQYLDDQQTHVLPSDDADLGWIARTLGYDGLCPFLAELDRHREFVSAEFDRLLGGGASPCPGCNGRNSAQEPTAPAADWDALLPQLSPGLRERVTPWRDQPRVQALRDEAQRRLIRLLQRTQQWLDEGRIREEGALRLVDWMETLLRRESYLALLIERPSVHERLLRLLGAARWPARYLMQHPGVIDELASDALFEERFDPVAFERDLETRAQALARTGEDDEEALLDALRRAHHAEVFRTLARDLEGVITVEQVADDLSALADSVLALTARWCWQRLRQRHRDEPQFAIIGYGKLGGKELGYGSDLDIVFVYEDEEPRACEIYAAFVRRLITWLTLKTGEGDLFEIDTALRPNGNSGLLVTRFSAYADYQLQRGSNTAWTWEHQAMTRARFVIGWPPLRPRFDTVRRDVITAPRDAQALKTEILAMRERVRASHRLPPERFDVKHSAGGMVDVEFAVQFLVLAHAATHPELIDNVGNIALLHRAEAAGLLAPGIGAAAADAYRELRRIQHQARLDEQPTQVDPERVARERTAVLNLWQAVFGQR